MRAVICGANGAMGKLICDILGSEVVGKVSIDGANNVPKTFEELGMVKADVVIVDEMSMVDVALLHDLLQATPESARLILVGDPDQLPPVGPGFPFRDMLRSNVLPSVHLTEIFRQAQESLIVMNAHRVNRGEMPELRNVKKDFFFLPGRSEEVA